MKKALCNSVKRLCETLCLKKAPFSGHKGPFAQALNKYAGRPAGMYYSAVKVCFFSKDFRQPVFSARTGVSG